MSHHISDDIKILLKEDQTHTSVTLAHALQRKPMLYQNRYEELEPLVKYELALMVAAGEVERFINPEDERKSDNSRFANIFGPPLHRYRLTSVLEQMAHASK